MSYTPIGWQTGDTITAEKLNKMDNGWSVSSGLQTYYNDNITTTDANNRTEMIVQNPAFAGASELKVTFDSVEYSLTGFDDDGYWTWGAPYNDFSTYPFSIYIYSGAATLVTQTAGTYALKIEGYGSSVDTSADFQSAVKNVMGAGLLPYQLIPNVTQYNDAYAAMTAGHLIYFWYTESGILRSYIVNSISTVCTITPTSSTFEACFPRDGGAFYINPLT